MNPQVTFLLHKSLEFLKTSMVESAENYLKQALKLHSTNPDVLRLLGVIAAQKRQYLDALAYLNKSLKAFPKNSIALSNLGNVFLELKEYENAINAFDRSIKINHEYHEVWSNKGNALFELRRYDEAIVHYEKALSLRPDYAEAWSNMGNTFRALKRYEESIALYERALVHRPDYAEAWAHMGHAFQALKYYERVIACHEEALRLKPELDWLWGDLQHTRMKICCWNGFDLNLERLFQGIKAQNAVSPPFPMLALCDSPQLHKECAQIYSKKSFPPQNTLGPIKELQDQEKIRIGYFSPDFHNHAVSILTAELFELHDKKQFEIVAFSFGLRDQSEMRSRLEYAFDKFFDVSDMTCLEIAKLARDQNIHIAVDLAGYTANSRTEIFSYRAAPIQIGYIGYLGTMGGEYFDYILADKITIPVEQQNFYAEKIAYLNCYQVNDRKRAISEKKFTREELGLPSKGFIFCCFNNNYKILPIIFDTWMRILRSVEDSVLFLYADNDYSKENLRKEANSRGIDCSRIVFGSYISSEENLARYRVCDLFLDTVPYNAGVTASDALWAGLPVLTMAGQSFGSRYAASLLAGIDLPELIVKTLREYEEMAIDLASDPQRLKSIKVKLSKNRLSTSLFDTPSFTKDIESLYKKMYKRYKENLQPDHLLIA